MKTPRIKQSGGPVISKPSSTSKPVAIKPNGKRGIVRDFLYSAIDPAGSDEGFVNEVEDRFNRYQQGFLDDRLKQMGKSEKSDYADDAFWAKYLGLPYNEKFVKPSQYKPSSAKDPNAQYYTIPHEYIDIDHLVKEYGDKPVGFKTVDFFHHNEKKEKNIMDPFQNITISRGKDQKGDYISIYDKYDLASNPLEGMIGNPYEIYDRIYLTPELRNRVKFKQDGGYTNNAVAVEQGEIMRDMNGNLQEVAQDAPSHDDPVLSTDQGNMRVPQGKGGIVVNGIESVLSDSQSQINSGKRTNSSKDELIKIKPKDAVGIASDLGLTITSKVSLSPSELFRKLKVARDKKSEKLLAVLDSKRDDKITQSSKAVVSAQVSALPDDDQLYDLVFGIQEDAKVDQPEFENEQSMQYGGVSIQGYKRDSPDRNRSFNIIPSNHITMDGVDRPLILMGDGGEVIHALPGSGDYVLPDSDSVLEIPYAQVGGYNSNGYYADALRGQTYLEEKEQELTQLQNDLRLAKERGFKKDVIERIEREIRQQEEFVKYAYNDQIYRNRKVLDTGNLPQIQKILKQPSISNPASNQTTTVSTSDLRKGKSTEQMSDVPSGLQITSPSSTQYTIGGDLVKRRPAVTPENIPDVLNVSSPQSLRVLSDHTSPAEKLIATVLSDRTSGPAISSPESFHTVSGMSVKPEVSRKDPTYFGGTLPEVTVRPEKNTKTNNSGKASKKGAGRYKTEIPEKRKQPVINTPNGITVTPETFLRAMEGDEQIPQNVILPVEQTPNPSQPDTTRIEQALNYTPQSYEPTGTVNTSQNTVAGAVAKAADKYSNLDPRWYDVLPDMMNLAESFNQAPVMHQQIDLPQISLQRMNPGNQLQAAREAFLSSRGLVADPGSSVGQAVIGNLNKNYMSSLDEILGNAAQQNAQIANQETLQNAQYRMQEDQMNLQFDKQAYLEQLQSEDNARLQRDVSTKNLAKLFAERNAMKNRLQMIDDVFAENFDFVNGEIVHNGKQAVFYNNAPLRNQNEISTTQKIKTDKEGNQSSEIVKKQASPNAVIKPFLPKQYGGSAKKKSKYSMTKC